MGGGKAEPSETVGGDDKLLRSMTNLFAAAHAYSIGDVGTLSVAVEITNGNVWCLVRYHHVDTDISDVLCMGSPEECASNLSDSVGQQYE